MGADEDESSDEENEDPKGPSGKGKPSLGKRKAMASRFEAQPKNRRKPRRAYNFSLFLNTGPLIAHVLTLIP